VHHVRWSGKRNATDREAATLELLLLCDDSGARRGFYDDLLALLCCFHLKKVDIMKANGRDSFVRKLEKKVKTPKPSNVEEG
jgi:hypothetical protein